MFSADGLACWFGLVVGCGGVWVWLVVWGLWFAVVFFWWGWVVCGGCCWFGVVGVWGGGGCGVFCVGC
ncbi:hypothetical protein, partial [Acinetobacter baumannii]